MKISSQQRPWAAASTSSTSSATSSSPRRRYVPVPPAADPRRRRPRCPGRTRLGTLYNRVSLQFLETVAFLSAAPFVTSLNHLLQPWKVLNWRNISCAHPLPPRFRIHPPPDLGSPDHLPTPFGPTPSNSEQQLYKCQQNTSKRGRQQLNKCHKNTQQVS